MNLYLKLLAIQDAVRALGTDKDTSTGYGKGFKYVTGAKVLDAIKPIMNQQKVLLKQEVLSIENVRQDYLVGVSDKTPNGKPKSEILSKVMMRFTWIDAETGEKDENLFGANGQNDWDKGVGSALTYGERYFLLKYFHIATDEDDVDAIVREQEAPPNNTPLKTPQKPLTNQPVFKPLTAEQQKQLNDLIMLFDLRAERIEETAAKAIQGVIERKDSTRFEKTLTYLNSI